MCRQEQFAVYYSNMKRLVFIGLTSVTLIGVLPLLGGCKKPNSDSSATQYTCPHHPEVVQSSPGKCPKCNMDLKPKT